MASEGVQAQEEGLSALEQACLDFCFSLLHHRLRTDEYESALIFALAVLGLTKQGFRGPHDYPSMLSGLIKTSRFMMTQLAVRPSECTQTFLRSRCGDPTGSAHDLSCGADRAGFHGPGKPLPHAVDVLCLQY